MLLKVLAGDVWQGVGVILAAKEGAWLYRYFYIFNSMTDQNIEILLLADQRQSFVLSSENICIILQNPWYQMPWKQRVPISGPSYIWFFVNNLYYYVFPILDKSNVGFDMFTSNIPPFTRFTQLTKIIFSLEWRSLGNIRLNPWKGEQRSLVSRPVIGQPQQSMIYNDNKSLRIHFWFLTLGEPF